MFAASLILHISLGVFLAFFFVLYYLNGDGKWKLFIEIIIGAGGNAGIICILDEHFKLTDAMLRMYSMASCLIAFIITTVLLLILSSFIIKDKSDNDILRIRDIILGQTSWVNKYYEKRAQEIDQKLNIKALQERELLVKKQEENLAEKQKFIDAEKEKLEEIGNKKIRIKLPENTKIVIKNDYVNSLPSYMSQIYQCLNDINSCTNSLLSKPKDKIDKRALESYFSLIAAYISNDIFSWANSDVRIHFRIFDAHENGYVKFTAFCGNKIFTQKMTVIPYSDDSMIKKSYECRKALIKSINIDHDYKSDNFSIWQDYMTYTFYGLTYDNKPFLSFGISVKDAARYKNTLYSLNFFRIEGYLQDNVERVNDYINIADILYGRNSDA